MARYREERPTYKLVFEDMDGLVVRVKSISVGKLKKLSHTDLTTMTEDESHAGMDDLLAEFAKNLVEWNLDDEDGNPVPPTLEGIEERDLSFILKIIKAWMETVSGVPQGSPLTPSSNVGLPYPAVSIPTESLSPSPSPFVKHAG